MTTWSALEVAAIITALGALVASLGTSIASLIVAMKTGQKVDGMLVTRDASNVAIGEMKGKHAAELIAEALKEGQRQGREMAIEETRVPVLHATGPLPVADDRTATAAERSATATERVADAAEK